MLQQDKFNAQKLLDALPIYELLKPILYSGFKPGHYKHLKVKEYNGFTSEERRNTGELIHWLQSIGSLVCPEECSICASTESVRFHSENYYALNRSPALCRACHFCIHMRFRRPKAWLGRIRKFALPEDHWAKLIPAFRFDLAGYMRCETPRRFDEQKLALLIHK